MPITYVVPKILRVGQHKITGITSSGHAVKIDLQVSTDDHNLYLMFSPVISTDKSKPQLPIPLVEKPPSVEENPQAHRVADLVEHEKQKIPTTPAKDSGIRQVDLFSPPTTPRRRAYARAGMDDYVHVPDNVRVSLRNAKESMDYLSKVLDCGFTTLYRLRSGKQQRIEKGLLQRINILFELK